MQRSLLSSKIILPTLALAGTSLSQAQFIFSGDFTTGNGQLELASDLNFNIMSTGFVSIIAFDDIVSSFDGDFTRQLAAIDFDLTLNEVELLIEPLSLLDNLNTVVGGLGPNDGFAQLGFSDEFEVVPGDTLTILAGTWINLGATGFNPDYNNVGTHTGGILLTESNGNEIQTTLEFTSTPEPTSLSLLALGLLTLARRRR